MRKILLREAYPELAAQLVDQDLAKTIGCAGKERVRWRCEHGHEWDAPVGNRVRKGYGCPYCSGRYAIPGQTDLATVRPDLAAELVDASLATQLKPTSHTKVEWRCGRGHVYSMPVSHRVAKGSGCPYCSGRRVIVGETDLATTHPELASQLVDQSLGRELKAGSNRKVEWRCPKCGGTWLSAPNTRTHMGSGCPHCAGKTIIVGDNDLATLRPDLAKQVVDKTLLPTLHVTSNKVIMWECENGHRWETSVGNRVQFDHGCPVCAAASHSSRMEREFADAVEDIVGADAMVRSDRETLGGKELDVVVSDARVAFEFNGVFWHSSEVAAHVENLSHVTKTELARDVGIRLVHVWEDEWQRRRGGVLAQVREVLGVSMRHPFAALSCSRLDDLSQARQFVSEHGMYDGACACDAAFGMSSPDGRLVAAMLVDSSSGVPTIVATCGLSGTGTHVSELLSFVAGELGVGVRDLRAVCDDGFDDGGVFKDVGMSCVGFVPPERMLVGQATSWERKVWDDELSVAVGMRKVYTSGKTIWAFSEDS